MSLKEIRAIDPGRLDKLMQIGRRSKKTDTTEQGSRPSKNYQIVGKFWACIETRGGAELEVLGKKFETSTHIIAANWSSVLDNATASDVLMWDGRLFEIRHVENVNFENVRALIPVTELEGRVHA